MMRRAFVFALGAPAIAFACGGSTGDSVVESDGGLAEASIGANQVEPATPAAIPTGTAAPQQSSGDAAGDPFDATIVDATVPAADAATERVDASDDASIDAGPDADDGATDASEATDAHYIDGNWFPCVNWVTIDYASASVHVNYVQSQGPHDSYDGCSIVGALATCTDYINTHGTRPTPLDSTYLYPVPGGCRVEIPTACLSCGLGTQW